MLNPCSEMDGAVLHTYHDGSRLRLMSAKTLIQIPIWKGNRCRDSAHVAALKEAVGFAVQHLDKGYHVIKYNEIDAAGAAVATSYIIDGQHRASVLIDFFATNLCEPDFMVTYTEIVVNDEAEAIAYFNRINNAKPIHYKEDPVLVVNRYIEQIVKVLPGPKGQPFFRDKTTHRPYLATERVREILVEKVGRLTLPPVAFARRIVEKNAALVRELELGDAAGTIAEKERKCAQRAIGLGFALGYDARLAWIDEVL